MPATVLYADRDMLEVNNDISAANRLKPMSYVNRIIGASDNKSDGQLHEANYIDVRYNALQTFPDDDLAKKIKPLTTEIATADIVPEQQKYNRGVVGVKIVISNLKKVDPANAKASIINSLDKQWDRDAYVGTHGNIGVSDNPKLAEEAAMPMATIDEVLAAIDAGIQKQKNQLGITDAQLADIAVGYTSSISKLLNSVHSSGKNGRTLIKEAYPDIEMIEMPAYIADGVERLEINYRPMLLLNHGAIPSQYATDDGEFKLSEKTLFVYESAAIQLDESCAIVRIPKA